MPHLVSSQRTVAQACRARDGPGSEDTGHNCCPAQLCHSQRTQLRDAGHCLKECVLQYLCVMYNTSTTGLSVRLHGINFPAVFTGSYHHKHKSLRAGELIGRQTLPDGKPGETPGGPQPKPGILLRFPQTLHPACFISFSPNPPARKASLTGDQLTTHSQNFPGSIPSAPFLLNAIPQPREGTNINTGRCMYHLKKRSFSCV